MPVKAIAKHLNSIYLAKLADLKPEKEKKIELFKEGKARERSDSADRDLIKNADNMSTELGQNLKI